MGQQVDCTPYFNASIVDRFLRKKSDLFSENEMRAIKHFLKQGPYPEVYHKDIIREILDELGMIPDEENIYLTFMDDLLKQHDINGKNILEVGGGTFPRFAKRLSLKQQNGTITVYDPRLDPSEKSSDKLILKKEEFTRKTPIYNYDLILGIMPCKGIDHIVDQVGYTGKDFMVWFCEGGPHGDYFDYYEDEWEWFHAMNVALGRNVEENKMGKIKTIEHRKYSRYPIVYNEREKE